MKWEFLPRGMEKIGCREVVNIASGRPVADKTKNYSWPVLAS